MTHATLIDTFNPNRKLGLNVRMLDPKVWKGAEHKTVNS